MLFRSFVPSYEASAWYGVGCPRNTPNEIVEKLNREVNASLADPTLKARLAEFGAVPLLGSAYKFGELLVDETEKWSKVVKFAGIKPD